LKTHVLNERNAKGFGTENFILDILDILDILEFFLLWNYTKKKYNK